MKRNIFNIAIIIALGYGIVSCSYIIFFYKPKPTQITKEVKIVDTEALQKLQSQFNQLQVEYDKLLTEYTTFTHHLETYERGWYDGYMRAKVIEAGE